MTYLLLGPEIGKKQDKINQIRKDASKKGIPEEIVFYAGETPIEAIWEAILNHSLFAPSRLIMIKNADQIKKEEDVSLIVSCMENMDNQTLLLFISDETKLASGFDNSCAKENKIVFYEMSERDKKEWVRSFFSKEGYKIDNDAINIILEMVENNTDAMKGECSRLLLFLPKNSVINEHDIIQWLSHNKEETAFTLFSRIANGDKVKALGALHSMLSAKERPLSILAGLTWCFKKLRDYLELAEKSEPNSFELKNIGITVPKTKDDYWAASRLYNAKAADACLALTAEYEILTRSYSDALENVLMDMYLLKVFGTAREAR